LIAWSPADATICGLGVGSKILWDFGLLRDGAVAGGQKIVREVVRFNENYLSSASVDFSGLVNEIE
jgi:hypothetical protein